MFKNAGLMIITIMLLVVPALANAWTLKVKVTGPTGAHPNNNVTLSGGATQVITGGTYFLYPTASTTATLSSQAAYGRIVKVDGVVDNAMSYDFITPSTLDNVTFSAGSHSVEVVYVSPSAAGGLVDLTQTLGGTISVKLPNNSWSSADITLAQGTTMPIVISAMKDYKIVDYTINGVTTPVGGAAGQVLTVPGSYVVGATNTITATYSQVASFTSATISAPLSSILGNTVTSKVVADATGGATTYAWSVTAKPVTSAVATTATTATFVITPDVAGNYTVSCLVTPQNGTAVTLTRDIAVAPAGSVNTLCVSCHNASTPTVITNFNASAYVVANPGKSCVSCHAPAPHAVANACVTCHAPGLVAVLNHNFADASTGVIAHSTDTSCVGCHSASLPAVTGAVRDNNGVRVIGTEFTRWSHHVTGVTLNDAHCAACHLEGKASGGNIVVDTTKHLADNKTHLRNADDDSDFAWNPEAPDFSGMDNFCMSCHDNNGATSNGSKAIQAVINDKGLVASGKTASASNPFGDTISNGYDEQERPAVVDASGQFNTSNASHHAVKGKKYTGRSRVSKGGTIADATFANNSGTGLGADKTAGKYPGKRSTIYDAGKFEAKYITLSNNNTAEAGLRNGGSTLGDDSTLHCADCHTVGQFAARGSVAFGNMSAAYWTQSGNTKGLTAFYKVAIGAHGANNEYLLRNNAGTNAHHTSNMNNLVGNTTTSTIPQDGTKPYLVCYNCHVITSYGSTGHVGEHSPIFSASDCNGNYNTASFSNSSSVGENRLFSRIYGKDATGTVNLAGFGTNANKKQDNLFGIQCAACHNSGIKGNLFGGIHGSKFQSYTAGDGNSVKHRRFMPGLNNVMYVPGVIAPPTGAGVTTVKFKQYSSNRDNATAPTYTELPSRTVILANQGNTRGSYDYQTGGIASDLNWEQGKVQPVAGQTDLSLNSMGCYTVGPNPTTAVAGANVNWTNAVPGGSNYQVQIVDALGARTVTAAAIAAPVVAGTASFKEQNEPKNALLQYNGYPVNDISYGAAYMITAGDGREAFDNWGGCDDHNQAKGNANYRPTKGIVRPISY